MQHLFLLVFGGSVFVLGCALPDETQNLCVGACDDLDYQDVDSALPAILTDYPLIECEAVLGRSRTPDLEPLNGTSEDFRNRWSLRCRNAGPGLGGTYVVASQFQLTVEFARRPGRSDPEWQIYTSPMTRLGPGEHIDVVIPCSGSVGGSCGEETAPAFPASVTFSVVPLVYSSFQRDRILHQGDATIVPMTLSSGVPWALIEETRPVSSQLETVPLLMWRTEFEGWRLSHIQMVERLALQEEESGAVSDLGLCVPGHTPRATGLGLQDFLRRACPGLPTGVSYVPVPPNGLRVLYLIEDNDIVQNGPTAYTIVDPMGQDPQVTARALD